MLKKVDWHPSWIEPDVHYRQIRIEHTKRALIQFIESPKTFAANALKLAGFDYQSWIGLNSDTYYTPKAPFFAMQMYTQHFGELLVQSGTASPTYSVPSIGVVNALDMSLVLAAWGRCEGCPEDFSRDGMVDVADLLIVFANWT